jgi:hypothetical protein
MNHLNYNNREGNNHPCVVENIYGIIDSRIQYLDYQSKSLVQNLIQENILLTNADVCKSDNPERLKKEEQWFLSFEKNSKHKKALLLLRNYLDNENALIVLSLLADEQLLVLSQKDLEYKLKVPRYTQAA